MRAESTELQAHCERLKQLGTRRASEASRRELLEGLSSKWEGVQVVAARALVSWGDAESLDSVRRKLMEISGKPARWSAAGAIAHALSVHISEEDVDWVVNLCLRHASPRNRFVLFPLFRALPKPAALAALKRCEGAPGFDPGEVRNAVQLVRSNVP